MFRKESVRLQVMKCPLFCIAIYLVSLGQIFCVGIFYLVSIWVQTYYSAFVTAKICEPVLAQCGSYQQKL